MYGGVHREHVWSEDRNIPVLALLSPVICDCCLFRPARASQELLGVLLALFMVAIEVQDYINWSRECYHRRLTMTVSREQDPPLYPIPGGVRNQGSGFGVEST